VGKGLFARQAYTGFGPSGLWPADQPAPLVTVIDSGLARRLRRRVREECPRQPGVYGMIDAAGALIYVGKAKCLRSRLLSYFRPRSRDPKAGHILADTRLLSWERTPSEFAALLRELELIRRWQPRWNVQGQPKRRRRWYLCVGRRPAPTAFLAGKPPRTALAVFGPLPVGRQASDAVRRINDWFQLRDCPQSQEMVFADQPELFPGPRTPACLRHELGACLGPCAALCSRAQYEKQVRAALAFLEGKDLSPLQILEREMQAAAGQMLFERAAALRDKVGVLTWLSKHLERLRQALAHSFLYTVASPGGSAWCYVIHGGRVAAVLAGSAAGVPVVANVPGPPSLEEIDQVLLVAAWFRKHPRELERTRPPKPPPQ